MLSALLSSGFNLPTIFAFISAILLSLTFHEFAHAWTADRFGDNTPRVNGRLTLNPLAHLDPIGTLMILFSFFGWAKPVPVNPYALQRRSPAAPMLVALAGPMSNLLLAVLVAIFFRIVSAGFGGLSTGDILQFLWIFGSINIALMLFNLIPLPPLDGHHIFEYFLPARWLQVIQPIWNYGPMVLILLVAAGYLLNFPILTWIIGPPMNALMSLLFGLS
jgi:Zn-dependent protease